MISSPTYIYYIKESAEDENSYVEKGRGSSNTYTFTELVKNTYDVKVEVKSDVAGNVGIGKATTPTEILAGDISFSNATSLPNFSEIYKIILLI